VGAEHVSMISSDKLCCAITRLITLNGMKASEEITEEQSRQVGHCYIH
jgi:hypothetical protein